MKSHWKNWISQSLIFTIRVILFYIIYNKLWKYNQASLQFVRHTVHCSHLRIHSLLRNGVEASTSFRDGIMCIILLHMQKIKLFVCYYMVIHVRRYKNCYKRDWEIKTDRSSKLLYLKVTKREIYKTDSYSIFIGKKWILMQHRRLYGSLYAKIKFNFIYRCKYIYCVIIFYTLLIAHKWLFDFFL